MRLSELQSGFRSWLEDGNEHFTAGFDTRARHGLDVYQNNYRAQLRACLQGAFPITLEWIGWAEFQDAAAQHIASCHPTSWTLDAYPGGYHRTLEHRFPADPEVSELALVEWALSEAFVSPDQAPVNIEHLVDINWEAAMLRFTPSLAIHYLRTNASAIWSALKQGSSPPTPIVETNHRALIVWRTDERCKFRMFDEGEEEALQSAKAGVPFGQLCEKLASLTGAEDATNSLGHWLGRWISDGLLIGVDQ